MGDFDEGAVSERPRRIVMRTLGVLIGLSFVVCGTLLWGYGKSGWWVAYAGPISMIITGFYFINFGIRNRETLFGGR